MRIKVNIPVFAFLVFMLFACDRNRVFDDYTQIPRAGWNKDSLVTFTHEIRDTARNYNLYINLRNKGSYPYSNFWLFFEIGSPSGDVRTDTIEFTLALPSGKWLGRGLGDLYDNRFIYRRNVFFPEPGLYTFVFKQGMREDVLKGIHDVGLRIERTR